MCERTRERVRHVWSTLEQTDQQQVIEQFRQTIKEMIDEHFRTRPTAARRPESDDLRPAVEPHQVLNNQGDQGLEERP